MGTCQTQPRSLATGSTRTFYQSGAPITRRLGDVIVGHPQERIAEKPGWSRRIEGLVGGGLIGGLLRGRPPARSKITAPRPLQGDDPPNLSENDRREDEPRIDEPGRHRED